MKAVDLFSGAGGFTVGAQKAGIEVAWAANHNPDAVEWHSRNNPDAIHVCQDIQQADWSQVPDHDMLLASPCCQGHSRARGRASGNPEHDASRSTAWAVVSACEYHRPPVAIVENVREFAAWVLYPAWRQAMEALGYQVAPHIIDAADHGAPQHRERLFLICTRSRTPLMLNMMPDHHIPARDFIDFEGGEWSRIDKNGRAAATLARVAAGRKAHGPRFIMPYYKSGSGLTGRSLDRPIGTITTRDRWAVVDGDRMRMLSRWEVRAAMSFPDSYQLPDSHRLSVHLMGNAVCPEPVSRIITAVKEAA